VILVTNRGQAIRFNEEEVRSMGLPAGGVGGIKLKSGDKIVYAGVVDATSELITLTAKGFAKRASLAEYTVQGRNGGGIVTHKLTDRTGPVCAARVLDPLNSAEPLVMVTRKGEPNLVAMTDIPNMGRNVQGKQVVVTTPSDPIVTIQQILAPMSASLRELAGGRLPESGAPASEASPSTSTPRVIPPRPPATTPGKIDITGKPVAANGKTMRVKTGKATTTDAGKTAAKMPGSRTIKAAATPLEVKKTAAKVERPGEISRVRNQPARSSPDEGQRTATDDRVRSRPAAPPPQPVRNSKTTTPTKPTPATKRARSVVETKKNVRTPAVAADGQAGAPPTGGKRSAKLDEAPVQSALFTVDAPEVTEPVARKKSSKVQTVLSVPAAQASQSKRKK
jgi:hypothetical protein